MTDIMTLLTEYKVYMYNENEIDCDSGHKKQVQKFHMSNNLKFPTQN